LVVPSENSLALKDSLREAGLGDRRCTEIRNLNQADLTSIIQLERNSWPADVQASEYQLMDRLVTFPRGFFGAWFDGELVGMASAQIVEMPASLHAATWAGLTADGWIHRTHNPEGNCLHFVSICVHPRHRGNGVAKNLNLARLRLGEDLKLKCALTDARLPGLSHFLEGNPNLNADDYLHRVLAAKTSEPVVMMYLELGFKPLGLLPHCMKSDIESADYGLAMAKGLRQS
jgi:GNAT superfamily N-acetyltransferase